MQLTKQVIAWCWVGFEGKGYVTVEVRKNNPSGALPIVDWRPALSWIERACSQERHDAP